MAWRICTSYSRVSQFCRIVFKSRLLDGNFSKHTSDISRTWYLENLFELGNWDLHRCGHSACNAISISELQKKHKKMKVVVRITIYGFKGWVHALKNTRGPKYCHIKALLAIAESLPTWYARFIIVCLYHSGPLLATPAWRNRNRDSSLNATLFFVVNGPVTVFSGPCKTLRLVARIDKWWYSGAFSAPKARLAD